MLSCFVQAVVANGLGDAPLCAPMVASDRFVKASARPIENLANALARQVGRPVIDRTGLAGNYDYNLEWSPELSATPDVSSAPANSGVPLTTALQEQLGLKLDSDRGPNQVIVIDRLDHPTPD